MRTDGEAFRDKEEKRLGGIRFAIRNISCCDGATTAAVYRAFSFGIRLLPIALH